jgi:hypothetical protein
MVSRDFDWFLLFFSWLLMWAMNLLSVQGEGTLHVVQPHCSAQQEDRDAGPDPYW